ncbi:MAG: TAXI family TRAP transporter solute-binding subunit [Planctomycetota bacterium]|jgi:TRAP transporter TAXI family solute receptor
MTAPAEHIAQENRKRIWLRVIVVSLVVAVPMVAHQWWLSWTTPPSVVRVATGPEGGRYRQVAESLGAALSQRLGVNVEFTETPGSIANLELLRDRNVDLALVQAEAVAQLNAASPSYRSVANVYSEVVQLLVRRDAGIESAFDLRGRIVSIGSRDSGEISIARLVLEHLNLSPDDDLTARYFDYDQILTEFRDGSLDAAIVTVGLDADILQKLAAMSDADGPLISVLPVPYPDALTLRHLSLRTFEIPAAAYSAAPHPVPADNVLTVAVRAQLVTHADVSLGLVEEATRILTDLRFDHSIQLRELVQGGVKFAKDQTVFPLHDGAIQFYDPELKPLLPPDFVEATEGARSFVVSMLVAGWLLIRWWKDNRERKQEHQLDRCILSLLEIERRQMDLDQTDQSNDCKALQKLLDEVTKLRQDALRELTAHDLNDDPAATTFIEMCHALSDKINAKLTRQRFDLRLRELIEPSAGK